MKIILMGAALLFTVLLFGGQVASVQAFADNHIAQANDNPDPDFVPGGGQGSGSGTGGAGSGSGSGTGGGGQGSGSGTGGGNNTSIMLENPLTVDSIEELIKLIIDIVTIIAVPIIILFIIYAGFLFVTAQGNEAQLKKAKTALLWTIIGAVLLLGANTLLDIIVNTVQQLRS